MKGKGEGRKRGGRTREERRGHGCAKWFCTLGLGGQSRQRHSMVVIWATCCLHLFFFPPCLKNICHASRQPPGSLESPVLGLLALFFLVYGPTPLSLTVQFSVITNKELSGKIHHSDGVLEQMPGSVGSPNPLTPGTNTLFAHHGGP